MRIIVPFLIVRLMLFVVGLVVLSVAIDYNVTLWDQLISDLSTALP